MKKQFAIISHDRHREDYVYLVECEEEELGSYLEKVWNDNYSWEAPEKSNTDIGDGTGSRYAEVATLKTIS